MDIPSDDAFLRELLELLDGAEDACLTDETPHKVDAASPRPKRRARSTSGAAGLKRQLDAARLEAEQLAVQLAQLRAIDRDGHSDEKARALAERRKRRRAEDDFRALRQAVYAQTRFLRGLRSVFSATPPFGSSLDLCRFLHRHTRLPRDRESRWGDYTSEADDARMRAAMEVLCRETENMSIANLAGSEHSLPAETPLVHGELIEEAGSRSTTSMAVYTLDTEDISAVVRAVCVAVRDVVTICPYGHRLRVSRDIVDVDASSSANTLYRVMHVHHECSESNEELSVESHVITSFKILDDCAIVLWDFVDADELHPTPELTNVTREITGACLIRREWGDDCVERTVIRTLSTKKFRLHSELTTEMLKDFVCISHPVTLARRNELLFRQLVLDKVAAEEAAYAKAQSLAAR